MILALVLGTLLAVGALVFVLYPLFADTVLAPAPVAITATQAAGAAEREAVVALREIEFDRATGKLSDADYGELHARYTARALVAMRGGVSSAVSGDPVELAVLAYRARLGECTACGPRPEPDAVYCSNCGRYLPGACGSCGSTVSEPAAAYCGACGRQLAA